jgi:hypothetical protein
MNPSMSEPINECIFDKIQRQFSRERTVFSTNSDRTSTHQKKKKNTLHVKTNSKCNIDLNIHCINFLEQNVSKTPHSINKLIN